MSRSTSVRITKASATHFVIFASFASIVGAFDLEKNVSAPPEIAPERPERLPDWRSTTQMRKIQVTSCTIVRTRVRVVIIVNPFKCK